MAIVPESPTDSEPAPVGIVSNPDVGPVVDVGNGLSLTVIVQLLMAAKLVPQVVPAIKNSAGLALGVPSVIAALSALLMVTVCGSDWVPCAVDANVNDVGAAVGAAAGTTAADTAEG